jgi:hypothetical protein
MATVVDELITKYSMDPSGYVSGATVVHRTTTGLHSAIGGLSSAFSGLGNIAGTALKAAAGGVLALGAAVVGFGVYAVNAAADFDTLQRSLEAITGSAQRAKEVLAFAEELAIPSIFGADQLAEAAKVLEAFQLKTERFLPVAEKLGTVFGGDATRLMEFVNALGYIQSGRTGEGLEALSRGGISRKSLEARGISFEKSGEYLGDINRLLDAIEAEVNQRFGGLAASMASGPAAQLASLWDQARRAVRQFGNELLTFVVPYVQFASQKLEQLVKSGGITELGKKVAEWVKPDGPIVSGVLTFVSTLMEIPNMIEGISFGLKGFIHEVLVPMYNQFVDNYNILAKIYNLALAMSGLGAVVDRAPIMDHIKSPYTAQELVSEGLKVYENGDPRTNIENRKKQWQDALSEFFKGGEDGPNSGKHHPFGTTEMASTGERIAEYTRQTAEHTKALRDTLREGVIGGAVIGQKGLTPREMARLTSRILDARGV